MPKTSSFALGTLAVAGAKVLFVLSSYGTLLLLPRVLADAAEFGRFATVLALIGIIDNVIVATTLQSVGREIAGQGSSAGSALRFGLVRHSLPVVGIALALALCAAWVTAWLRDASLTLPLQVATASVAGYGLYAVLLGVLNGTQRFGLQALVDGCFSLLRFAGLVLGAWLTGRAFGAFLGLGASLGAMTLVCGAVVTQLRWQAAASGRRERAPAPQGVAAPPDGTLTADPGVPGESGGAASGGDAPGAAAAHAPKAAVTALRPWLSFVLPLLAFHLGINALLQLDITLLKLFSGEALLAGGVSTGEASATSSRLAGHYRAAQSFAFVAYQLAVPLALTAFPVVSRLKREGAAALNTTLVGTLRAAWIGALLIAIPISANSHALLSFVYPEGYAVAATSLAVLAPGLALFAVFVIVSTALAALGHPARCALFALIGTLIMAFTLERALQTPASEVSTLTRTAVATSSGIVVSLGLALYTLHTQGAPLPYRTLFGGGIAAAVAWWAGDTLSGEGFLRLAGAGAASALTFVLATVLTGAISRQELAKVRRAVQGKVRGRTRA